MTQRLRTFQRLQRLVVLNRAGLLHVQRLLVVGELAFQLIHFQFSGSGPTPLPAYLSSTSPSKSFHPHISNGSRRLIYGDLRFVGAGRGRNVAANERSGISSFIFSLSRRSGVRR